MLNRQRFRLWQSFCVGAKWTDWHKGERRSGFINTQNTSSCIVTKSFKNYTVASNTLIGFQTWSPKLLNFPPLMNDCPVIYFLHEIQVEICSTLYYKCSIENPNTTPPNKIQLKDFMGIQNWVDWDPGLSSRFFQESERTSEGRSAKGNAAGLFSLPLSRFVLVPQQRVCRDCTKFASVWDFELGERRGTKTFNLQ